MVPRTPAKTELSQNDKYIVSRNLAAEAERILRQNPSLTPEEAAAEATEIRQRKRREAVARAYGF